MGGARLPRVTDPYFIFDSPPNPWIWDPSQAWPPYARLLVPLAKAGPTFMLYVVALWSLGTAGFMWPWQREIPKG